MATFTFYTRSAAYRMVDALEELNTLAQGSTEYNAIRDLWEEIIDDYVQCRHRDCGLCNGVGCEESVVVEIPNAILNATKEQRDKASKKEPSLEQQRTWAWEDRGGCHL